MFHIQALRLEQLHQGTVDLLRVPGKRIAVDPQEHIGHRKSDSFVAIYERMVLDETLEERRRLMNERVVVTGLRSMKGGLECTGVANAGIAAVALDQDFVKKRATAVVTYSVI